jgi:hypothetical protein
MSFRSRFLGGDGDGFDDYDEFRPAMLPDPGAFLAHGEVLTGDDHAAVHRLARALFEERGVYDVTFGYNLARLNLDHRHPDAGFRYARDPAEDGVVRAEFTPTTEFCPQSDTLTVGAFRAWNGLAERHEYDLVRVRVAPVHTQSGSINGTLEQLEQRYRQTGTVPDGGDEQVPEPDTETNDYPF